jgi:hypothetical protein
MALELRALIHFLWLKHSPNQAILSELDEVHGNDVITLRAVEKLTASFDGGGTELADLPRPGGPRDTEKVDAIRALIEGRGWLCRKKIAQMLGVHLETMKRLLRNDLKMRKMNFQLVQHAPGSSQKAVRVQFSRELFDFLESRTDRSLSNVSTGDEI